MFLVTRLARILALVLCLTGPGASLLQAQTTASPQPPVTAAQEEYVPIDELPDSEKMPAAPFLIAAYIVVWSVLLIYVLSLWRRLSRVEADLREARRTFGAR